MKKTVKTITTVLTAVLAMAAMSCSFGAGDTTENSSTGLLEGAGEIVNEGIKIDEKTYAKTSEVIIVPSGKTGIVDMRDDSSWITYVVRSAESMWKGVFIRNRKITLSPFVMSQYEVTQELYEAVMETNPSKFLASIATNETQNLRPVEQIKYYEAIAFCNVLTQMTMTEEDIVYFSDKEKTIAYTKADAVVNNPPYLDISKKGYRLPTEAEWEYAARGGNPQSDEWQNAFGKVTTINKKKICDGLFHLLEDENLATVGWYSGNSGNKTHEVGLKDKNNLNLYDMAGNVWEWCWDKYADVKAGTETNPCGATSGSNRVNRGGCYRNEAYGCASSFRSRNNPSGKYDYLGFRICRSISD